MQGARVAHSHLVCGAGSVQEDLAESNKVVLKCHGV